MSNFKQKYIFYFILAVIAAGFLIYGEKVSIPTQAAASNNVSGFAWSENIGWVSFNNLSDGSPTDYGVSIAANGDFSGYAWSENIGWISFNRSDTGNPPSNDPGSGSGPIAKYNYGTGQVLGWARALANGGGWDGWIRFDTGASSPVTLNASTGDFSGYAWGSDVVGWLSFNSADAGAGGGPYKVVADVNIPPSASSLQISAQDYCASSPSGLISFQWQYSDADGDDESQYQLQVDDNSDFSSPAVDLTQSLTLPSPSSNGRIVYVKSAPGANELAFNQTYYWRAKVWDNGGADSGFVNGPASFATAARSYPTVDFTWNPANPSAVEQVRFTDASTAYGASVTGWSWNFQDGAPASSSQQNPQTTFTTSGTKTVNLQVQDSGGFSCAKDKTVNVQVRLPSWKEIKSAQ